MACIEEINKINCRQRLTLYETASRFFLVGSNAQSTQYRILKIDRTETSNKLSLFYDKHLYNNDEFRDLFRRIYMGNKARSSGWRRTTEDNHVSGLSQTISAFGLIGFVRFTEGYYMVLITKRRKVAQFGQHIIYKIEDTSMVYIPRNPPDRSKNTEETRYMKLFQSVDLSSNFYFSYTYDLTNTVQYNLHRTAPGNLHVLNGSNQIWCVEQPMRDRFVWNSFLMEAAVDKDLQREWILPLIHGFIDQTQIFIHGQAYRVTLIARRSRVYAGTRFLKRGCNRFGDVANEVETEQVVHEAMTLPFHKCPVTSFVQMRGSIPIFWGQDLQKVVKKPDIIIMKEDPYCSAAGAHFRDLLERYGSPVIVFSLVKQKEKRFQEGLLTDRITHAIEYLNQFIPREHHIRYRAFDVARCQKSKNVSVLKQLTTKSKRCVLKNGFFHLGFSEQHGIIRTNCVDCLDRTNTSQFVIGRVALGLQLHALGVLQDPDIEDRSSLDCLLEDLYEDHGDTLALQYGGSQLVHTINTYRKTAPLTSQTRDILQTLSRYYSNAFSDVEKQAAINLFLGIFRPSTRRPPIWDLPTDMYLHFNYDLDRSPPWRLPYSAWLPEPVLAALPRPYCMVTKREDVKGELRSRFEEDTNWRDEYLRPFELTTFNDLTACFMTTITYDSSNSTSAKPLTNGEKNDRQPRWEADRASSSEGSSFASRSNSDDSLSTSWEGVTMDGNMNSSGLRISSAKNHFGISMPSRPDKLIYEKFASTVSLSGLQSVTSVFRMESTQAVIPPVITKDARKVYAKVTSVAKGSFDSVIPENQDLALYRRAVGMVM